MVKIFIMNIYTVHLKSSSFGQLEDAIFIQEGFSWKAAIFYVLYTLYHRLWLVSAILIGLGMLLTVIQHYEYLSNVSAQSIKMGVILFLGFNFNDIRRWFLEKKGYNFTCIISGNNEDDARYRFLEKASQYVDIDARKHIEDLI